MAAADVATGFMGKIYDYYLWTLSLSGELEHYFLFQRFELVVCLLTN